MKILITGHKGFIGSHILNLLKPAHEVTGFDLGDEFPEGRFDFIVHLAARGLIRKSLENPYGYFTDDLDLTMKFLDMARKSDSTFIFPSSGSTASPSNPYSLSKKQSVEWINLYRRLYSIKAFDLTFYNIYGSGSRKGGVYLFSKMALAGGPIIMLGDGTDVRDFVYVTDVAKFVADVIDGKVKTGSYEIGTGIGTSIRGLSEMISEEVGGNIDIVSRPDTIETAPKLVASVPALKNPVLLRDGIRKVIAFIKEDELNKSGA